MFVATLCLSALILGIGSTGTASPSHSSFDGTLAQHNARMAWWRHARFGMFIHWGLYSEAAGYWKGKPTPGLGEWIMNDMHIPRSQYATLASHFDPVKFNALEWVKLAKQAGMKYLVITSKHHDGFCMFNTKATSYNVVDDTPWRKDPLLALSKACRHEGIKFCVYYSIMDWHSRDQAAANPNPEHPTYNPTHFVPGKKRAYVRYMKTQLKELVRQYHPRLIWFDGDWMHGWTERDGEALYRYLRSLDPALIINNRVSPNRIKGPGDYLTPEEHIPAQGYPGHDWETCMTINNTWGYKRDDHDWKSARTLIFNLCDIASKGGNFLLNVGPNGLGVIPQPEVERLKVIGRWMKVNGQAIYGTSASPPFQNEWGKPIKGKDSYGKAVMVSGDNIWRCTTKPGKLYVIIFKWPAMGMFELPGLQSKVTDAFLLANHEDLKFHQTKTGLTIDLPAKAPGKIASVICVKISDLTAEVAPFVGTNSSDRNKNN